MVSSRMLHRVALVRTDDSEKLSASFIRVTRIGEPRTTLAVSSKKYISINTKFTKCLVFLRNVRRLLVTAYS
jgi:hypothetical protein